MAQKRATPTVQKRGDNIKINLGNGASINVDLSGQKLTAEQKRILQKTVSALKDADPSSLVASGCPSKPHLEPAEFENIRGLKARVGATGGEEAVAGLIADFCMHVVKVG